MDRCLRRSEYYLLSRVTLRGGGGDNVGRCVRGGAVGIAIMMPCPSNCYLCGSCCGRPHNVYAAHSGERWGTPVYSYGHATVKFSGLAVYSTDISRRLRRNG